MQYSKAIRFLYELQLFGAILGLDTPRRLAHLVGNPQERLRFIHVAGTNGKGSTCAMLESIYRNAGYQVGLYTSPHLISFAERIQVNREMIPEDALVELVDGMRQILKREGPGFHPTFFEVVTVIALQYFAARQCDLVIWETGLGGRLDATNIVIPELSLITNVQLDHEAWLGNSLEKIAREKAGIIKPGVPVIAGEGAEEVREVISRTARECNSHLRWIALDAGRGIAEWTSCLPLMGGHQLQNAATAMAAVEVLQKKFPVPDAAIREGLLGVRWPGRLQQVTRVEGQTILLDGAHNPAGAEALRAALKQYFPGTPLTLVFGVMHDKNWKSMSAILAPLARRIILAPVASERTASTQEVAAACAGANPQAEIICVENLKSGLSRLAPGEIAVVTGSLYFVGEALELLDSSEKQRSGERGLNEWTGRGKKTVESN